MIETIFGWTIIFLLVLLIIPLIKSGGWNYSDSDCR